MTGEKKVVMSPSPVTQKPHPLHNFELPRLSWTKSHTNNHIRGRSKLVAAESSSSSSTQQRRQQMSPAAVPQPAPRLPSLYETLWGRSTTCGLECGAAFLPKGGLSETQENSTSDFATNDFSDSGLSSDKENETSEKENEKSVGGSDEVKDKTYVRLRLKNKKKSKEDVQGEEETKVTVNEINDTEKKVETAGLEADDDQFIAKTWNLRPRKPLNKSLNANATATANAASSKAGGGVSQEKKVKGNGGKPQAKIGEKKEKEKVVPNFSIALSRGDIEEDFFTLTGSKPSKRPKKRAKAVQKQLDNVFPGLWLASITPDDYKVDGHSKG